LRFLLRYNFSIMTTDIVLIFLSLVIIVAYVLDILSSRIKIPPIVFLVLSGLALRVFSNRTGFSVPYVEDLLPTLGAVGLILIVLDAGLDLELNQEKLPLIRDSFFAALVSLVLTLAAVTGFFYLTFGGDLRACLLNAIPFSIISSAIAIPGARHIDKHHSEFVTYESSFSDILGILVFNLVLFNSSYGLKTFFGFGFEILATTLVSVIFSLLLTLLLGKINHKIKYLPIFSVLLLAYSVSKMLHFSPLILVLVFGLLLNNFHLVIRGNMRLYLDVEKLRAEIGSFTSIIRETTFVVKVFFFLLLGYSVSLGRLAGTPLMLIALPLLAIVYVFRYPSLYFFRRDGLEQLMALAPRGLITILLFMGIPEELRIARVNDNLMVWIILGTSGIMTLGLMMQGKPDVNNGGAALPAGGAPLQAPDTAPQPKE